MWLGIIVSTIQIPGWIGAVIPTAWVALFVIVSWLLFRYKIEITLAHILGSLFLFYAGLSLLWAPNFNIAFFEYCKLLVLGGVFCIGSCLQDLRSIYKGLAIGLGISATIGLAQYLFDWQGIFTLYHNIAVGLFINNDLLCEFSAVMLVVLVFSRLWFWIPVTLPGLLLNHSRAAILGLTVGLCMWAWSKSKILVICILVVCVIGFYFKVNAFNSAYDRLIIWIDTARNLTIFGHGIGSFDLLYPSFATMDTSIARPMDAHNDWLQLIFDLGIGVLFIVPVFIKKNIVLVSVATIALFDFPLHVPVIAFIWALVAGHAACNTVSDGLFSSCFGSNLFTRFERQQYATI